MKEHAPLFNLCMCTRGLRMGEKSCSFIKIRKNRKKSFQMDATEKICRAGVSCYIPWLNHPGRNEAFAAHNC